MACAFKLYARSVLRARIPMLCPVLGLVDETLNYGANQIMLAMEELIRVGKIFFPSMDIVGEAFQTFREVLDTAQDRGG